MGSRHISAAALAAYAIAAILCIVGYAATNAGSGGWAAAAFALAVFFAVTGLGSESRR